MLSELMYEKMQITCCWYFLLFIRQLNVCLHTSLFLFKNVIKSTYLEKKSLPDRVTRQCHRHYVIDSNKLIKFVKEVN